MIRPVWCGSGDTSCGHMYSKPSGSMSRSGSSVTVRSSLILRNLPTTGGTALWRAADYAARHTAPLSAPPSAYDGQPLPLARFEWTHHAGDDRDDWLARLAAG